MSTIPQEIQGKSDDKKGPYCLRLFITGASANSLRAVNNIRDICEKYLHENYFLEVIDVYQDKPLAEIENIVALPLLIKSSPLPERRMIGDLSDTSKVLRALGYQL
jgi:circadian clock protein KaiB